MKKPWRLPRFSALPGCSTTSRSWCSARLFGSPHHTVSDDGLVGGGHVPRPGEVSLAHNGVLFLDEFTEFRRNILDLLRQPLEDGQVTIARARISLTYPARFMLVAAMNPCPCGYWGSHGRECRCGTHQMQRYRGRISRSILDRIDLYIEVPAVRYEGLHSTTPAEPSAAIRERVVAARNRQLDRFSGDGIYANALMKPRHIKKYCHLDDAGEQLLAGAVRQLGLSARAYHRILKVYLIRLRTFILLVSCLLGFVATQPNLQFSPLHLEMKKSNL